MSIIDLMQRLADLQSTQGKTEEQLEDATARCIFTELEADFASFMKKNRGLVENQAK